MRFVLEMRETQTWKHDERLFRGYLAETLNITVNTIIIIIIIIIIICGMGLSP
jgi:hypothetical protein